MLQFFLPINQYQCNVRVLIVFLFFRRELLLNQNYLRVLPYELGKLFQLQVLGLHGNPLSKEMMALYGEPQGTHKLLSFMLDNLQGMCFILTFIIDVCLKN